MRRQSDCCFAVLPFSLSDIKIRRSIQKICDACKKLGTDEPEYIVHGEDIMVKFIACQSAKVTEKVTDIWTPIEKELIELLRQNPSATYPDIATKLNGSRKTVAQKIKLLKERGVIIRVGSAKKGHWKLM